MRNKILVTVLILSATILMGQQASNNNAAQKNIKSSEDHLPVLSVDQLEQFYKAQAELNAAQTNLEHTPEYQHQQEKMAEFRKIVIALNTYCGEKNQLMAGPNGDPICSAKPTMPAPPEPPAKK